MAKVRTPERAAYEKAWRAQNSDRLKAANKRWRENNAPKIKADKKAHYEANKAEICAKVRANRKPLSEAAKARREERRLMRATGFTAETLQATLLRQNNCCAICEVNLLLLRRRDWHCDHDHETNAPRGVLCSQCNMALGLFKDDVSRLTAAIAYLKDHGIE